MSYSPTSFSESLRNTEDECVIAVCNTLNESKRELQSYSTSYEKIEFYQAQKEINKRSAKSVGSIFYTIQQ